MDQLDFIWNVIESQGLVACMFAYMIIQQKNMLNKILTKNCELNHFIMRCLDRELVEDLTPSKSPVAHQKASNHEDLPQGDNLIPY